LSETAASLAALNHRLLKAIADAPPSGISELAERAGLVHNNINRKLEVLLTAGLLEKTGDASWDVKLTEAGERGLAAMAVWLGEAPPAEGGISYIPLGRLEGWAGNPRQHIPQKSIVDMARAKRRKLVIGYILRVHPAWIKFIELARTLGKPLVMRMNLNQQSHGNMWNVHRNLMKSMSPIVDCGVHYVDVMCQMTGARPTKVCAIGARMSDELKPGMYNYGQLQVTFDDGSVGWYEAGWGPMMSEVAFFVKDVIGPRGCVSIVKDKDADNASGSADIDSHTKTNRIRFHRSEIDANNEFVKPDEWISTEDEPDHQALCDREQAYLLHAIQQDVDLSDHMQDAVNSLRIVLAADESVRSGQVVTL